jgi:hypothetical protein
MNLELESLIRAHYSKSQPAFFDYDSLLAYKDDLATACQIICGDIMQHFDKFIT